jgi:hypothetical protein
MRRSSDYGEEMFNTTFSEDEMEQLLTGSPDASGELSDLAVFVEMMRSWESHHPSETAVSRFAVEAASLARAARPPAGSAHSSHRPSRLRWALRPQVATVALLVLMIAGMTGVAAAADAASPGHGLYGLDRALEKIGIGAGSGEERLEEASQLVAEGEARQALEHATEAFDGDGDEEVRIALEVAIEGVDSADEEDGTVQEKVRALLAYMSQNIGAGVGADGREFGQGVAALARDIAAADTVDDRSPSQIPAENEPEDRERPGEDNQDGPGRRGTEGVGPDAPGAGEGTRPEKDESPGPGTSQGGGNAGTPGNGNGNGPDADSPSVTAPGRGNRP